MRKKKVKELICSRCKQTICRFPRGGINWTSDDGYGIKFNLKDEGKTIYCIRRSKERGSLHFWDRDNIDGMREDWYISKGTYGVEATIILAN